MSAAVLDSPVENEDSKENRGGEASGAGTGNRPRVPLRRALSYAAGQTPGGFFSGAAGRVSIIVIVAFDKSFSYHCKLMRTFPGNFNKGYGDLPVNGQLFNSFFTKYTPNTYRKSL
jgi:hypothetical protein